VISRLSLHLVFVVSTSTSMALAQNDPTQRFEVAPSVDGLKLKLPLSLRPSQQTVTVVARFSGDPITVAQSKLERQLTAAEKQQIRSVVAAQQAAVRPRIEALGARVLFEFQNSLNGIKVSIRRDRLSDLARIPGVVEILPVVTQKIDNLNGVPLIGAPAVWDVIGGAYHGEGIKVAVIDSGIDYTHANFGGPGTVAAWNNALANSTQPPDPALVGPTAPKVKGGTDLVGDDYDPESDDPAKNTPHPDSNPLDCDGHGSHVSGTVAGFGVLSTGATYTGTYGQTTLSSNAFRIGPGVAPKADLYEIRAFGCVGATNVVDEAIEWAVDHDVQVINMSLGSDFGTNSQSAAANNAAKAGVLVVASAGNEGSSAYLVESPSTGDDVISVAATDPIAGLPGARMGLGTGSSPVALNANGATLPGGTLPIVVLRNANGTVSQGCDPAQYVAAGVTGKIVVTIRGTCARVARAIFGQQAGAAAVAMINNAVGYSPFEGEITSNPDTGEQYTVTIPFLGIQGTGTDPVRVIAATSTTLTATTIVNPTFKAIGSFSSSGPRTGDSLLKPDVAAPGVSIFSTGVGTGNRGAYLSGTSMASPHVAGLAALALQAHPTWQSADVRPAIVNTADPGQVTGYSTRFAGTGLVQAPAAVATQAFAFTNEGTHVGFGFEEINSDFVKEKPIKVRNRGTTTAVFDITITNQQGEAHTVVPSVNQLVVPPGEVATFTIKLTVPSATVRDDTEFRNVAGIVRLTPTSGNGGATLRVPYFLVPRGLSNVTANLGALPSTKNPSGTVVLANTGGPIAGNADFYALGIDSNNQGNDAVDVRAVGMQSFPFPSATNPTRQFLIAALNSYGRWNNASTQEYDIAVDVNGDGSVDYVIIGFDFGLLTTGFFDGRLGVFIFTVATGELTIGPFFALAPTDSSTVLLPFLSTNLCRPGAPCFSSAANPRMTYAVAVFDLFSPNFGAPAGVGRYNPWTPAISNQGDFFTLGPNQSTTSPFTVNTAEWEQTPARGIMVVTTDNKSGASEAATLSFTLK